MSYRKTLGRLTVAVTYDGSLQHDYGHGCQVSCVSGWNDSCPIFTHAVSVEELRDLRYLLDRAITDADEALAQSRRQGGSR